MDFYIEGRIDPENKDHDLRLIDKFIWEVPELGAVTRKIDREALKYFISKQWVDARAPYGKFSLHKPALANFIATVNNENGFLNDPTGSRRFMVTTLTSIDWDYATNVDVKQIWAQAYELFKRGETGQLKGDDYIEAELLNAEYKTVSTIYDRLEEIIVIEDDGFVLTNDILDELKNRGHTANEVWITQEVAAWMKERGIVQERKRIKVGGVVQRPRGYIGVKLLRAAYSQGGPAGVDKFSRSIEK